MKRLPTLMIFFAVLLLSGCATLNVSKQLESTQPLGSSFQLSGAIAAKNQQHGWIANFTWVQRGRQDYQILLNGPLGSDTIDITMHQGILTYAQQPGELKPGHRVITAGIGDGIPYGLMLGTIAEPGMGNNGQMRVQLASRGESSNHLRLVRYGSKQLYSSLSYQVN